MAYCKDSNIQISRGGGNGTRGSNPVSFDHPGTIITLSLSPTVFNDKYPLIGITPPKDTGR